MKLNLTQELMGETEGGRYKRRVFKARSLVFCFFISVFLHLFCYGFASKPVPTSRDLAGKAEATDSTPNSIDVNAVCELIYRGQFEAAGQLANLYLGRSRERPDSNGTIVKKIVQLEQIVTEYQAISQRRREALEAAYQSQITKLEKLQANTNANDVNDVNDVIDINDVNDIVRIFSVFVRAIEFADERQKKELLSDSFLNEVFQKAIERAAEFESEGKWLDAYVNCYSWLEVIDANNQVYSDYAEQLREKANIVGSFQDSSCESRRERFDGVEGRILVRAVDFLRSNYVNTIDYRQMGIEGIERCELLAEVVKLSFSEISKSKALAFVDDKSTGLFLPPDSNQLSAWSAGLTVILDEISDRSIEVDRDSFIEAFEKVLLLNAVTIQLPRQVLVAHFTEAALSALDSYTVMVWPKQVQEFEKIMTNKFTGIGIRMTKEKGQIKVASLLPDTPAYHSGLDAGDVIEAVDGETTKGMSTTCAVKRITGPRGTKVTLTIRRLGNGQTEDQVMDITITRGVITVPTVYGWQRTERVDWLYMIDEERRIGYVRISSFAGRTASDLEQALLKLESEGLRGLILDLRFNTGGFLPSAIEITDKFVKDGLIVSTRPPRVEDWTFTRARKKRTHPDYPLVVLINSDSASASEIVAGALGDPQHNRAILVGDRTHGKGSVQAITEQPRGAQLKYTMAYYHLPSGQRVESREMMKKRDRNDWGVGPDVEVKLRSDEIRKMSQMQWDNLVLARADHDSGAAPLKKYTIEETIESDPQLAVGLLVIKSKLIESEVLVGNMN
jgi:carboxyl-terminal processing protease